MAETYGFAYLARFLLHGRYEVDAPTIGTSFMWGTIMRPVSLLCAAAILAAPGMASAAVILSTSGTATTEIHNNGTQSGTTVTGLADTAYYDFTSTSTLSSNGNGVAAVSGPIHILTIAPSPPVATLPGNLTALGFTAISFDLQVNGNKNKDTPFYATFVVTDSNNVATTFTDVAIDFNSEDPFYIYGNNNEVFKSVEITGWKGLPANDVVGNFDNIKHIRVNTVDLPVTTAVPEPATWAMMIGGFGLIGLAMRRRRQQKVSVTFA